jgi:calcineurin-like phosphoesterase family protein
VKPEDLIIHLCDVAIGNRRKVKDILAELPGRKALVPPPRSLLYLVL